MAILDADKEGFLRSQTSLIQTIGRAARNVDSRVVLYADKMTDSMKGAIGETDRRRAIQVAYNTEHNITPQSVKAKLSQMEVENVVSETGREVEEDGLGNFTDNSLDTHIEKLKKQMLKAAADLEFEEAAGLRDQIKRAEKLLMELPTGGGIEPLPKDSARRRKKRA